MTARLTYFDTRGRAEVARLILEEAGAPYEEHRVQFPEWPGMKPTLPFGQLPLYTDGDLTIVQSHAIYRHLARRHDFIGSSEAECVRCDIAEQALVDAHTAMAMLYFGADFAARRDGFERDALPGILERLEAFFEKNDGGKGWWIGDHLTLTDFLAWYFLDCVRPFSQGTLDRFELLCAFKHRFETRPRIAAYLASPRRPKTMMGPMAAFGSTPETS